MHLIQPILISSLKRCIVCQDGKATAAVITNTQMLPPFAPEDNQAIASGCSGWFLFDDLDGNEDTRGEFSFGITCAESVTLEFTAS